ncbi:hypothetical protein D3C86_1653650 [compost metagenome]
MSTDFAQTWVPYSIPYLSNTHPSASNYESYVNGGSNKMSGAFGVGVFVFGSRYSGSSNFDGHPTNAGLIYSSDAGQTWTRAELKGFQYPANNPNILDIGSTYRP